MITTQIRRVAALLSYALVGRSDRFCSSGDEVVTLNMKGNDAYQPREAIKSPVAPM